MSKKNFNLNSPLGENLNLEAKRLAVIDVGSNTVRMMVVEGTSIQDYRYIYQAQEITRLGEGLSAGKPLNTQAARRTFNTICQFCQKAREFQAQTIRALGTSALRRASDGQDFILSVKNACDIDFDVVSGEDEARITLRGVETAVSLKNKKYMMIDIGGGSTEFILTNGSGGIDKSCSIEIGAVSLTERFVTKDPPDERELAQMAEYAGVQVSQVLDTFPPVSVLVGTAGTITTLAAIAQDMVKYDASRINNYILTKEKISNLLDKFKNSTLTQRQKINGLEPKRADIIIAGTIIALKIMERLKLDEIIVCDAGFREGIVIDLLFF